MYLKVGRLDAAGERVDLGGPAVYSVPHDRPVASLATVCFSSKVTLSPFLGATQQVYSPGRNLKSSRPAVKNIASDVPAIPPPTTITSETGVSQCVILDPLTGKHEDHLFLSEECVLASSSINEAVIAIIARAGGADAKKYNRLENILLEEAVYQRAIRDRIFSELTFCPT